MLLSGMGEKRMPSQSCTHFKARVQDRTSKANRIVAFSHNSERLRTSTKTKVSGGLCPGNASKESDYSGKNECKPGILQQVISSAKAREKMEASDRSQCCKYASIGSHIQDGDCRNYSKLHLQRGVGCISRSNRRILPHSYPSKISKPALISRGRTFVSVQSPTFRYCNGSTRIHPHCQRGKAYASKHGYTHPPVPGRLVIASSNTADLHGAVKTTGPVRTRARLGDQLQKIRVNTNSKIRLPGVQVRLDKGRGLTHRKKWLILTAAIEGLNNSQTTTPRILMSFIGILASLEKTVPMGRLHMRPFQWYLKTHWKYPQSLDKRIPCSEILKKHLVWWKNPKNVLTGCPLHVEEHNLLLFTDASIKGWGAHLGDLTISGLWSDTEANLHINILEMKAVFLAIRSFQSHLLNQRVLVASDNATVVAYLNKQGGTHSLEMCLMVWRLMAFCNPRAILLRARHIQGCLNVIADSLSRRDKIIQTEWSLHPKIFQGICQIWHRPMVDLFATKMNNKLPLYVSPVPDPNAMAVDALNISWQALDGYVYCPVALIPKVVQKMRTYACRMIVVAPGWPGMSWFWDLIELSTKPPLLLPHWETLLRQPFSHRFHQNLQYLNLHVWHLDSRQNHLKNSLSQWQRELRHLRDFHQEGSMNQGGPFLSHGANRARWSSKNLLFPQ